MTMAITSWTVASTVIALRQKIPLIISVIQICMYLHSVLFLTDTHFITLCLHINELYVISLILTQLRKETKMQQTFLLFLFGMFKI